MLAGFFHMLILLMGVAGSGKTLIGSMLAQSLGLTFADADQFHSAANIQKMAAGVPLTDADREPWLRSMRHAIDTWTKLGQSAVLACSALKQSYRDRLTSGIQTRIVYLRGDPQVILNRLSLRRDHFMKPGMLSSQLADLEEPADAIVVDIRKSPSQIIAEIQQRIRIPA
jgi:gluconokinase